MPPGKSSHLLGDGAVGSNDEYPAGILTLLPCVEGIDEVEAGPWHLHRLIDSPRGERIRDDLEALVVGEPRRPRVLGKPLLLERCRVQGEPKRRMPRLAWNLPPDHDTLYNCP